VLVERGVVDKAQIDHALSVGEDLGERLGETLMRLGWASEEDLAGALAVQWQMPHIERSAIWFDPQALSRMNREDATRLQAVPMLVDDRGATVIAVAEPAESRLLALRSLLGDRIDFVVVSKTALDVALGGDLLSNGRPPMTETNIEEHHDDSPFTDDSPIATDAEAVPVFEQEPEPVPVFEPEPVVAVVDSIAETRASDFDDLASALNGAVAEQLTSMRAMVVDAEAARDRDQQEVARLAAEIGGRDDAIAERDRTIAERDQAIAERDQAIAERDQAIAQRDQTIDAMRGGLKAFADQF
jgi:uncharacterized coiled-coil protein SlyX